MANRAVRVKMDHQPVVAAVCRTTGVSFEKAIESGKRKNVALTRNLITYYLKMLGYTYERIGEIVGGKDHSTIRTNFNRILDRLSVGDNEVCEAIFSIDNILFPEA